MVPAVFLAALAMLIASCAPAAQPAPAAPAPSAPAPSAPAPSSPRPAAPQPSAPAPSAPSPSAPAATATPGPRAGGVLTMVVANDPASFDLHQDTIPANIIANPAYNRVVQYSPVNGMDIVPDLAESWSVSKDGLTYTFKVRQGVKFHNGAPLTADDIAFTLQRVTTPPKGLTSVISSFVAPATEKIEVVDASTVQVKLKFPFAPLLSAYAMDTVPVYSKAWVQDKGDMKTTIMGTGPFKYKFFTPSVSAAMERNPDYWVKGRPYLDGTQVFIVKDANTRVAALRTGKARMGARGTSALSPSQMETIKKEVPQAQIFPIASSLGSAAFFNTRVAPLSDVRVRKAFHLAIDRQAAIKVVAEGAGTPSRFFPLEGWGIPEKELLTMPGFRADKSADIAEAKKLLADAGFPNGLSLTLYSRQNQATRNSAIFMTDQLTAVGIQAKVEVLEDTVFWDKGYTKSFQVMVFTPAALIADPVWFGRYYFPGGSFNFTGNEADKKLSDMWTKQAQILDPTERHAVIRAVDEYAWNESVSSVPLVIFNTFVVAWPEVKGLVRGATDYATNNLQEIWLAQ
ncbi:MAG: ABC transporter substrate-binding protein [Dehalococcoidia bacterium]|nr:ABC transporter substrate-binding protein [Dehalococcoidia bacterium]